MVRRVAATYRGTVETAGRVIEIGGSAHPAAAHPGLAPPAASRAWTVLWDRLTVRILLLVGLPLVAFLMLLTTIGAGGQVALWENAHWTAAGLLSFAVAMSGAHRTTGLERRLRLLVALGTGLWAAGQLTWNLQVALGPFSMPAPSDVGFFGMVVPVGAALMLSVRQRLPRAEELAVYLDSAAIFLAISAATLAIYGDGIAQLPPPIAALSTAYPIFHLATAGAGLIALLATRNAPRIQGGYLVLIGLCALGFSWIEWLREAVTALPPAGGLAGYAFSVGIICVGLGASGWRVRDVAGARSARLTAAIHGALPMVALFGSAMLVFVRHATPEQIGIEDAAAIAVIVLAGIRQTLLVDERGRLLDDSSLARAQLEVALDERAEADSRYRILVERVPAAVYIDRVDPDVSDGGRLAYMSPQIQAILGYSPEAFIDDPELWPRLIHPDDLDVTIAAYADHWATARPLRADYRMVAQDGSTVWVHDEAYSMTEGSTSGLRVSQGLVVNITEQRGLQEKLQHDALHDPLTGLANRVLFRDHVERALAARSRRRAKVAVLFLDLDDFKVVNDSLGHHAGDRLLIEVARRLHATIRGHDIAARQGGDEFTILLDGVRNVSEATETAERLADEIRRPIDLDGSAIVVGVSIGIAMAGGAETGADDLLAHADAAMYEAKGHGRARYAVFDPSMRLRVGNRLQMETELRAAIDGQQLILHYQPIVDLASGRCVSLEALVRWQHPRRGLVGPIEFIPLAEASGLIVPLGRQVTMAACRQLRALRDAGICDDAVTMSVNVSPRQAVEPKFVDEVRSILTATGLEPAALVLEITESLMLHESVTGDSMMQQLHEMGVQLVVDDFGTGFSALEYFKRFSVQGLKIDRSFIAGVGTSREDTAIVAATLAFAEALDLSIVAEGIETDDQLQLLRSLGCLRGQGFLFSRPVPAEALAGLFATAVVTPGIAAA